MALQLGGGALGDSPEGQAWVVISEIAAANRSGIVDEDGDSSDWIELYNRGDSAVDIGGWFLTDDPENLDAWSFPPLRIEAKGFLVVFASGKNRRDSDELHTNFRLDQGGDYLALVKPDGRSVVHAFSPAFPEQYRDISYGIGQASQEVVLLSRSQLGRFEAPSDDRHGFSWTAVDYDDRSWLSVTQGVGFQREVSGFRIRNVKASGTVGSLMAAESVLANPALQTSTTLVNASVVNYFGTQGGGHYGNNEPFPGQAVGENVDDFVIEATGVITIPEAGEWTFGVNSDDGFELSIGDQVVAFPQPRSASDTLGVMEFASAGDYELRLVYYERGGGASLEFFGAQGAMTFWNEEDFRLIGDISGGGLAVRSGPVSGEASPSKGEIVSNVEAGMFQRTTSGYLRLPFDLETVAPEGALTLRIRYDDGFVAYLNGEEIARRNVSGVVGWDSQAEKSRPGLGVNTYESVNVTGARSLLKTGRNMLAVHGVNSAVDDPDFLIEAELVESDISGSSFRYFSKATPGAVNSAGFIDFVADTKFDRERGFYTDPFRLSISTATPDATIRYTTTGEPPTATTGIVYRSPVLIDETTVIRAAAFKEGFQSSNVDTLSFFFLEDVIRQSPTYASAKGWPRSWGANVVDYGMDPDVVDNPAYRDTIIDDLQSLPTFSIVTDLDHLFNSRNGIYANPRQDGRNWERPASVELMFPDGREEGFQIDAGIRIRGGFSRSTNNPKHAFRLFFREEYGASKLIYPLFGEKGTDTFDGIDLRTFQNYSWSFQGDSRGIFIRDVFNRDAQFEMGRPSERGELYHLYINGMYWGIFNTAERPEASYGETYFGGDKEEYDVIKVEAGPYTINATDGNMAAWRNLWSRSRNGFTSDASYQGVQGNNPDGTPNPDIPVLVDVPNLIDYMLIILYGGNLDAPISNFLGNSSPNNFFAVRNRNARDGFRFFVHDAEHTLLNVNQDRTGPYGAGTQFDKSNPQYIWQRMQSNAEFRMLVADHVHRHFFNGGVLTPEGTRRVFDRRIAEIERAVVAESARWGDSKRAQPFTRNREWRSEVNNIRNNYLPRRSQIVLNQLRQDNLYPNLAAPSFSQHGGNVAPDFMLRMSGGGGTLYYTKDGSDPRLLGGGVAPTALVYRSPIPVEENGVIRARARSGSTWSAMNEAEFVRVQDFQELVVSELMYNPTRSGEVDGDQFEFIELKNVSEVTLDLSGVRFVDGIEYEFEPGSMLEPGAFLVLVRNREAFLKRYPNTPVYGQFTGALSNGGERIAMVHATGDLLLAFEYEDRSPWPMAADGSGFSLVTINPAGVTDPSLPGSWRAGTEVHGSPGQDDLPLDIPPVLINEVLANSDAPLVDAIELYNPGLAAAAIGGWFLSDDLGDPQRYQIPDGLMIESGGYLVITEDQFASVQGISGGFRLSSMGEAIYLFSADSEGHLTGYTQGFRFPASQADVSFGRYIGSEGRVSYPAQATLSLGEANSGPRIGPVVINEIRYHPIRGEDEFVELKNRSDVPVKLYDEGLALGWRINGLGYDFGPGSRLEAGEVVLIVGTEPSSFRQRNGIPEEVRIFGPYPGTLQDGGETLTLLRPGVPVMGDNGDQIVPYIAVDSVRYDNVAPWPLTADGQGPSLERISPHAFGDDPVNWRASLGPASAGVDNDGNRVPIVDAGTDETLVSATFPVRVTLSGMAVDDGLPMIPGELDLRWRQVSGNGQAVFENAQSVTANVLIPGLGDYELELVASDGEFTTRDRVTISLERPALAATLVEAGARWRYLDDGSNQGTAWRSPGFNDSSWRSGNAQLGYGDGDEATSVSFGPNAGSKFVTTYYRHAFNVSDAASVRDLVVSLVRDDGAIVYLNGREIFRSAMPAGNVTFQTFASAVAGGGDESTFYDNSVESGILVEGRNVLAVEIHQANAGSSDTSFDLRLTGTAFPVNRPPTLELTVPDFATVTAPVFLMAAFVDDGLPSEPGYVAFQWEKLSGPGDVVFDNATTQMTEASFTTPGVYQIRLTGDDGQLSSSVVADVDVAGGVGVPAYDEWAASFFDSGQLAEPSVGGADADPDEDGFLNRQEYVAGTNPLDALDFLKLESIQDEGGQLMLGLKTVFGRVYEVQGTAELGSVATWAPLVEFSGNGESQLIRIEESPSVSRYYRLHVRITP